MAKKVYSGLKDLPTGSASDNITEGCLVLEGGAFRGLYTQGFLDALMVNDINIRCTIGVSAGALSGVNYISGQIGRSGRINLGYRHDSRYVGIKALLHSRSILDIGFLTEDRGVLEPLDRERLLDPKRRFVAVATNCLTGEPTCFESGECDDIMLGVRASATMPYISPAVMINGIPYLDGGCSCKIPYQWALDQDYEKIVVLKTRDIPYRKEDKSSSAAFKFYKKYPKLAQKLSDSNRDYNHQCDEIEQLHAEGRLLRLAPSKPITIARIEKDMEKLGQLYHLGWNDCISYLNTIKEYLGIS